MLYSLITLSYDKLAVTQRCLGAVLRDSVVDGPWEIVAVDNGSRDGTRAWLSGPFTEEARLRGVAVRVLTNDVNVGCSTARNQALAAVQGNYLVFLDNDVAPRSRHWLGGLRAALESDRAAGMAGPKLVYPVEPYDIQCAGVGLSRRGHVCFYGRGEPRDDPRFGAARTVQCLVSACLMVRAELIRRHGGFDEAFNPVQFEDFDLCYRLRREGWRALYRPEVEMYHFESVTTQGTPTVSNPAVVVRNGLEFQRRWRGMFAQEDGPDEDACRWRKLPSVAFERVGEVPLLG
jgi:GT2 family glycosyltransferase